MIAGDPNVQSFEAVAAALGDLCDQLVLVGGCAAGLLIDAPSAPPPCVTYDLDLIAVVAALRNYHALEAQFATRGLQRDISPEAPVCRWRLGTIDVDLMPRRRSGLGIFQSPRLAKRCHSCHIRSAVPMGRLMPGRRRPNLFSASKAARNPPIDCVGRCIVNHHLLTHTQSQRIIRAATRKQRWGVVPFAELVPAEQ